MWEKCVQIMYSSINNSKIHPKLTKPPDRMGRIWTVYLLCARITLETTALRVIWTACLPCTRITLETTALRVTYRCNGSDLDGISPLHPYYSRDYRSTSHLDGISPLHPYYSRDYRSTSHVGKMCTGNVQINK